VIHHRQNPLESTVTCVREYGSSDEMCRWSEGGPRTDGAGRPVLLWWPKTLIFYIFEESWTQNYALLSIRHLTLSTTHSPCIPWTHIPPRLEPLVIQCRLKPPHKLKFNQQYSFTDSSLQSASNLCVGSWKYSLVAWKTLSEHIIWKAMLSRLRFHLDTFQRIPSKFTHAA
jgi:hypothetical protein